LGHEGVIGFDAGETLLAEALGELPGAAAVVEDGDVHGIAEDPGKIFGVGLGPGFEVIGIEAGILVVVNLPAEVFVCERVEGRGKDEAALGAAMIINGNAGEWCGWLADVFTGFVEVGYTKECGAGSAAFARVGGRSDPGERVG